MSALEKLLQDMQPGESRWIKANDLDMSPEAFDAWLREHPSGDKYWTSDLHPNTGTRLLDKAKLHRL